MNGRMMHVFLILDSIYSRIGIDGDDLLVGGYPVCSGKCIRSTAHVSCSQVNPARRDLLPRERTSADTSFDLALPVLHCSNFV